MYNTNERDKMSKEYDATDHIALLSELKVATLMENAADRPTYPT